MAPQKKVEFVILKLTFSPFVHPKNPKITFMRKKHSPSGSMSQVRDWFNRVMSIEKSKIPANLRVSYSEWDIKTGNRNLFTINGYCFDKVRVILGEEVLHWMFYKNMMILRRIEGSSSLSVNYCGCCINNQYLKIMKRVKDCVMKRHIT